MKDREVLKEIKLQPVEQRPGDESHQPPVARPRSADHQHLLIHCLFALSTAATQLFHEPLIHAL